MRVFPSLCLIVSIVGAAPVVAGDAQKGASDKGTSLSAGEVLQRASAAMKEVSVVRYRAEATGTGWVRPFVPDVRGTAIVGGRSKWDITKFYCDVVLKKPDSEEELKYAAGCDGDVYFLLDAGAKTVYEDMDPAVMGSNGRGVQRVVLDEFAAETPLEDYLEAKAELIGTTEIGGVACHQVQVEPERGPKTILAIGQKDFLPRQIRRIYPPRGEEGGEDGVTRLTLIDLEVNPELSASPFTARVPEGYTKTSDFAP